MNTHKINRWFYKRAEWILGHRVMSIILFVVLLGLGLIGLKGIKLESSWESYFLENDPMLVQTDEFKSIFGNDYYVAVLTECDNTFSHDNLSLIRELSNELMDSISYADKITSLTDLEFMIGSEDGMSIEQIVPEEIPTSEEELEAIREKAFMKEYVANRLVSADGKNSWILLKLRPFPDDWKKEGLKMAPDLFTGKEAHEIITKEKYAPLHLRGTGMPYITYRKIDWINMEMPRIMIAATIFALILMSFVTRSVRGVVIPLVTAFSSILMAYGVTGYLKMSIDSSMMMVPLLLVFAISIAYNIHLYSFFRREMLIHGQRKKAAIDTIANTGWPILFSALTTFVALLSFLFIPLRPMHFVGVASSFSVLFAFISSTILMPISMSIGKDKEPNQKVLEDEGKHKMDIMMEVWGKWVLGHQKLIFSLFILFGVVMLLGLPKLESAFDVERTMGRGVPYVNDILEVSDNTLGSLYSYDLMIDLNEDGLAKQFEALAALDSVVNIVNTYPLTKRTSSILNIIKDLNQTIHDGDPNYYTIPKDNNEIAQLLLLYDNAGGSEAEQWMDYEYRRLRLNVEMNSYNSKESEKEIKEITEKTQALLPNAEVTPVGSLPQFTSMMQYVSRGQIVSVLISLVIIGILMMIAFGSVHVGLIALIPNILPVIAVGGLMGWLGYPLDMMTATIMPMVLGLAVDDTIHLFNHCKLEFEDKRNYRKAILHTFRVVGTPILLTSSIICTNFLAYFISDAKSYVHMALLAIVGILVALLADLCVTPLLFKSFNTFGKEEVSE